MPLAGLVYLYLGYTRHFEDNNSCSPIDVPLLSNVRIKPGLRPWMTDAYFVMFYCWTFIKLDIKSYFGTSIEHNTRTSIEHPLDDGCYQGCCCLQRVDTESSPVLNPLRLQLYFHELWTSKINSTCLQVSHFSNLQNFKLYTVIYFGVFWC